MGRRSSSFSLTNSGRTKSWTLNCVSRTRFRKAGERRKRRGRCTNLLIKRGYAREASVASDRHLTLESLPCSACIIAGLSEYAGRTIVAGSIQKALLLSSGDAKCAWCAIRFSSAFSDYRQRRTSGPLQRTSAYSNRPNKPYPGFGGLADTEIKRLLRIKS